MLLFFFLHTGNIFLILLKKQELLLFFFKNIFLTELFRQRFFPSSFFLRKLSHILMKFDVHRFFPVFIRFICSFIRFRLIGIGSVHFINPLFFFIKSNSFCYQLFAVMQFLKTFFEKKKRVEAKSVSKLYFFVPVFLA